MPDKTAARVERKTQRQRREATIAKLVDATIDTIIDHGYYRTTIAAITDRAGVSVGAMFRHFNSRHDLIAQVAEEISERVLTAGDGALAAARESQSPTESGIALLAALTATPLVAAWHEMLVAARTDSELRERIAPVLPRFYAGILDRANSLGILRDVPESMREVALFSLVHMFSGAALTGGVHPRPDLDAKRIPLAAYYFQHTPDQS